MNDFDIFVSYSVKNTDVAEQMIKTLEAHGLKCWIAPRNIMHGSMWAEEIVEAIKNTKGLVLIYSRDSSESSQVPKEIGLATSCKKRIFPFCIDDTPLEGAFLYHLSDCQLIPAQTGKERKMQELADILSDIFKEDIGQNEALVQKEDKPVISAPKEDMQPETVKNGTNKKSLIIAACIALAVIVSFVFIIFNPFAKNNEPEPIKAVEKQKEPDKTGISNDDSTVKIESEPVDEAFLNGLIDMPKLTNLYLTDAGLNNNSIEIISKIPGLRTLSIKNNPDVTDITPLSGLNLKSLDISNTGVSDISSVTELPKLTELYASGNGISDITAVGEYYSLERLDLSNNKITDISVLSENVSINSLNISGNQIKDISVIAVMQNLQKLDVSNNLIEDITPIADNKTFAQEAAFLDLSQNKISDAGPLAFSFPKLKYLNINRNNLQNLNGICASGNMPLEDLYWLDISDNNIEDISPMKYSHALSKVYVLNNPVTNLSERIVPGEYGANKQGSLHISYNESIDWETASAIEGLNIHVYDMPQKQQHILKENGVSLQYFTYEEYVKNRDNNSFDYGFK